MQEEKKNNNDGEGKKNNGKPSHKRGYFISPPKEVKSGNGTVSATTQKENDKKSGDVVEIKKHKPPHHRKRNGKPDDNKNIKNEPKEGEIQKKSVAKAESAPVDSAKNNNRKRQKNKKRSDVAPNNATTEKNNTNEAKSNPPATPKRPPMGEPRLRQVSKDAKPLANHSADDYEEYKLVVDDANDSTTVNRDDNAPKTEVVGIRFKSTGKIYYFAPNGITLKKGAYAIVDTARGQEFGEVAMANSFVRSSDIVPPLRTVLRQATAQDVEHNKINKQKEEDAFRVCTEKIKAHNLDMKLIDAQYTFDNSKLLFYFTSSERVDFRELVKDLAGVFRTRIELRQIGIRDEAKLMGGLGMCGRPLCCTLFLSDFDQVSIKMAKEQNLSLNSAKISGICGRLMCCLKYEHEAYEYEIKRTPPVDSLVRTENGDGIVTEISPLAGTIKVRLLASPEVPPKVYKRDEVSMLRKKQNSDKN